MLVTLSPRWLLGASFSFNGPAVCWLLSSAALGLVIEFFPLLVSFVFWKLRGCDRWWNYDIIYRIPVLSVIYHLVDHRGCLPLTTQRFTDSWSQPLLGLLSSPFVSSSFFVFWDAMNNVTYPFIQCIPVLSVIYCLIDHRGCLLPTTQRFTDSCLQPLLGCYQVISSLCPLASWDAMNNVIRLIVQRIPVVCQLFIASLTIEGFFIQSSFCHQLFWIVH